MSTTAGKKYRFVGNHAEEVVPGRFVGPGDEVKLTADEMKEDLFKRLRDEGQLLEIETDRKEASK